MTVANPPPVGGASEAVAFPVTTFTLGSSPTSATPGGGAATTTLTLTTRARQNLDAGAAVGSTGGGPSVPGPPRFLTLGLLLLSILTALLLWFHFGKPRPTILARRWLAACAVICLVVLLSTCSAGGGGPSPSTGTPAGTYQVTVQGASGGLTVSTTVTMVVN